MALYPRGKLVEVYLGLEDSMRIESYRQQYLKLPDMNFLSWRLRFPQGRSLCSLPWLEKIRRHVVFIKKRRSLRGP